MDDDSRINFSPEEWKSGPGVGLVLAMGGKADIEGSRILQKAMTESSFHQNQKRMARR